MTRLRGEDILDRAENLKEYNQQLINNVGKALWEIAAHANGVANGYKQAEFNDLGQFGSVAIIPISSGQGIISGFSRTVQKIIEFLGFPAFVTGEPDVGGLAEAVEKGGKVIFLADDDHFVAINMAKGKVVDNGKATGKGYAAALDLMSGGLRDKKVLLLGAGPVGRGAAAFMSMQGAKVFVYDIDRQHAEKLTDAVPGAQIVQDFHKALPEYKLLFDATPSAEIIGKEFIREDTMIAAPGIPLGLSQECLPLLAGRLVHDMLEIGVATMLFEALA